MGRSAAWPTPSVEGASKPLKVGLIVDSEFVSKSVFELAAWGQLQRDVSISHLIIQQVHNSQAGKLQKALALLRKRGVLHLLRAILFLIITNFEFLIITKSEFLGIKRGFRSHCDHLKSFDVSKVIAKSITIKPIISKSGFVYRYPAEDIKKTADLKLDVLIRCGSGILRGNILNASSLGVISFHHGNNKINRGGPPGFWEVYFHQESTVFVIQQLTEEIDGGNVLFRGSLPTQFFYLLNQAFLFAKSTFYLEKLLVNIAGSRK